MKYLFVCFLFVVEVFSVQLVPVEATPQPENVSVRIVFPGEKSKEKNNPIWVQVRLRGYALGTDSNFERAKELSLTDRGQTLHIVVDDRPYFPVSNPGINPFNLIGDYYEENYRFAIPYDLKEGLHTLRVYCARSYGESLKSKNSYDAVYFYIKDKKNDSVNLNSPLLTYNQPSMRYFYKENQPILLDFLLSNCSLSEKGYRVRVWIDEDFQETLTTWQPYYIYGLKRGKHLIRLELIDSDEKISSGSYNSIEHTIIVH